MKLDRQLLWLTPIIAWLVAGCERLPTSNKNSQKTVVVATTTHMADLARQIGGEHIKVIAMMKSGVDPHSYRPTAHDITSLHNADLILFHGLSLEGKMAGVLKNSQISKRSPFSPCSELPGEKLLKGDEPDESVDPHLWFSPELWVQCGRLLADELSSILPHNLSAFEDNFIKFQNSVSQINEWGKTIIQSLPASSRVLITSHDAFRYFGHHFGIKVVALQGINTMTEAGLADRTSLVNFVRKHNSPPLFIESSVNPKALKEIARETGANIGGTLFSDALGPENQFAKGPKGEKIATNTWQGMMAHNLRTIATALRVKP